MKAQSMLGFERGARLALVLLCCGLMSAVWGCGDGEIDGGGDVMNNGGMDPDVNSSTSGGNNAAPNNSSTPNNASPNNAAPNNSTVNNATPNNAGPNNSDPNNATPNNATPNNADPNNGDPNNNSDPNNSTVGEGGCGLDPGPNDRTWTVSHDGESREFIVHLPAGYDASRAYPVVIDFHGRALDANNQVLLSGMRTVADAEGFIAVHPEGTGFSQTWNAGLCCGEAQSNDADDVGFVAAMLDKMEAELCMDASKVYATGISNGGFIAHRLACELSERITAIAPVAGVNLTLSCNPSRAVPVFAFHGTADNIVPYDGYLGIVSVESTMNDWKSRNGCSGGSAVFFEQDDVRCEEWSGCDGGGTVRLCTVEGGGHTWPGGTPVPFLGETTDTISASQMMWDFFEPLSL